MNNQGFIRLREVSEFRDFLLHMLLYAAFLVLLLVLLVSNVPHKFLAQAVVVVSLGLLLGGAVGIFTGVKGPVWLIFGVILTGVALLLLSPAPWRGFAFLPVPVSAIGYAIGKEMAFHNYNRRHQASPSTWVIAGKTIESFAEAKQRALSLLQRWESPKDGRFTVVLGQHRFEAWGDAVKGFVVHVSSNDQDLETLSVLTQVPHQNDEVSITLDTHGLVGLVPRRVRVPTEITTRALDGFFETHAAKNLPGWAWERGIQAQELRFM